MAQLSIFDIPAIPDGLSTHQRNWCACAQALTLTFDRQRDCGRWAQSSVLAALVSVVDATGQVEGPELLAVLVAFGCPKDRQTIVASEQLALWINLERMQLWVRRDEYPRYVGVGRLPRIGRRW
jgi:hypothetical protein